MEQLLTFFLGVLSVATLIAVGIAFRIRKEIQDYKNQDEYTKMNFERDIWDALDNVDRRIDQEIDRCDTMDHKHYEYADKLYQNHEDNLNELYKYVDSRTDKMADATAKHISEINQRLDTIQK